MFVLSKHNSVCLLEYYVSVCSLGIGGLTGTMHAGTRPKEGEPILIVIIIIVTISSITSSSLMPGTNKSLK